MNRAPGDTTSLDPRDAFLYRLPGQVRRAAPVAAPTYGGAASPVWVREHGRVVGIVEVVISPILFGGLHMTMTERAPTGRVRAAWAAAHAPVPAVPRWARMAAYAVPLTVLPSSVWRIAMCTFHLPIARKSVDVAESGSGIPGLPLAVYVVLLSVVSELLAFTAVGLIARWGETFPRWIPFLRGRAVPARGAVVLAAVGATALTLLWTWMAIAFALDRRIDGSLATGPNPLSFDDWQGWVAIMAYAPLLLWGPLLGAVTIAYWKRRHARKLSIAIGDHRGEQFLSTRTMAG